MRQPDHAAMSERIARAWPAPSGFAPAMWERFLSAVRRHDDGWRREEERPTLDPEGGPYDFKRLPARIHAAVWRRSVELAERDDPYLALIIAQHGRWLEGEDHDSREFIEEMDRAIERNRARLAAGRSEERAGVEPEAMLVARRLLSFFDAFSLFLLGAVPMEETEPLRRGAAESSLRIRKGKEALQVQPWPFEVPALRLEVEAARLEATRFRSPEEFAEARDRAPRERLRFQVGS